MAATIVADFVKHLRPSRERCWIAEKDGKIVGAQCRRHVIECSGLTRRAAVPTGMPLVSWLIASIDNS